MNALKLRQSKYGMYKSNRAVRVTALLLRIKYVRKYIYDQLIAVNSSKVVSNTSHSFFISISVTYLF